MDHLKAEQNHCIHSFSEVEYGYACPSDKNMLTHVDVSLWAWPRGAKHEWQSYKVDEATVGTLSKKIKKIKNKIYQTYGQKFFFTGAFNGRIKREFFHNAVAIYPSEIIECSRKSTQDGYPTTRLPNLEPFDRSIWALEAWGCQRLGTETKEFEIVEI